MSESEAIKTVATHVPVDRVDRKRTIPVDDVARVRPAEIAGMGLAVLGVRAKIAEVRTARAATGRTVSPGGIGMIHCGIAALNGQTATNNPRVSADHDDRATIPRGKATGHAGRNARPDEGRRIHSGKADHDHLGGHQDADGRRDAHHEEDRHGHPDEGLLVQPDEGPRAHPGKGPRARPGEGLHAHPGEGLNAHPGEDRRVHPGEGRSVQPDEHPSAPRDDHRGVCPAARPGDHRGAPREAVTDPGAIVAREDPETRETARCLTSVWPRFSRS